MNDPDTSTDSASVAPRAQNASHGDEPIDAPAFDAESPVDASEPETAHSEPSPAATAPGPVPHAGARYALLRLLMLVAVGGILYIFGVRGWLLAFAAILVSGVLSLFLLMKQRNDAAVNLERTLESRKRRRDPEDAGLTQE